jgi:hypothetical protein
MLKTASHSPDGDELGLAQKSEFLARLRMELSVPEPGNVCKTITVKVDLAVPSIAPSLDVPSERLRLRNYHDHDP